MTVRLTDFRELSSVTEVIGDPLQRADSALGEFVIDSRSVGPGSAFAALPGTHTDGHRFVQDAVDRGAGVVLVRADRIARRDVPDGVCVIRCTDVLSTLQELASLLLLRRSDLRRVGITGSTGKTGTKEALAAILGQRVKTAMTRANFNSAIGLPLEVLRFPEDAEVAVLEMGMNRPGEIAELVSIARPDPVVITNIGTAHAGMVGGPDGVLKEKLSIVWSADVSVVAPGDDSRVRSALASQRGQIRWHDDTEIVETDGGVVLRFAEGLITLSDQGWHHARNAICAIRASQLFGCTFADWKAGLEAMQQLPGRAQISRGLFTLIDDTYNAAPASMLAGIRMAATQARRENRDLWLVLGEMAELGEWAGAAWDSVFAELARLEPGRLVLVGRVPEPSPRLSVTVERAADVSELQSLIQPGEGVLIYLKAANSLGLGEFARVLRAELPQSVEASRA